MTFWRTSGQLYMRAVDVCAGGGGTEDQRVLACPTSRKTSSMSAIVWGLLGARTRCEKEMSCSRGQANYLQHPINLLLRREGQLLFQLRERKTERKSIVMESEIPLREEGDVVACC